MTCTSSCVGRSRFNEVRVMHTLLIRDVCETEQTPSTSSVGFLISPVSRTVEVYMPRQRNRGRARVRKSCARHLQRDSNAGICCSEVPHAVGAATTVLLFALVESHATPDMFAQRLLMPAGTVSALS